MPLDVAIQVVNYRTRRHLEACLPTVLGDLSESGLAARVLVLDNASGDDLSELAGRHPEVEFDAAERNLGFGAGHNALAARARRGGAAILNPDTRVHRAAHGGAVARGAGRAAWQAVGPQLVSAAGRRRSRSITASCTASARASRQAAGDTYYRRAIERVDVAWVSGAACLVARGAFDAVGGFDPGFFLYKEEEDLFLRIRRAGGRVRYLPVGAGAARRRASPASRDGAPARVGGEVRRQAHPLALPAADDASDASCRGGVGRAARPFEGAATLNHCGEGGAAGRPPHLPIPPPPPPPPAVGVGPKTAPERTNPVVLHRTQRLDLGVPRAA